MKHFAKAGQICMVCLCLISAISVNAQVPDQGTANQATANQATANQDERAILLDAGTAEADGSQEKSPSSIWVLLRVVFVLALVCAGIYGVVLFLKKAQGVSAEADPYLKSVAQLPLGSGKSVQVVTIGSRAFLLGVTEQSISQLGEITDKELIDAMNLAEDKKQVIPGSSFASIIKSFIPSGLSGQGAGHGSAKVAETTIGSDAAESIRRSRERLRGGSSKGTDNE